MEESVLLVFIGDFLKDFKFFVEFFLTDEGYESMFVAFHLAHEGFGGIFDVGEILAFDEFIAVGLFASVVYLVVGGVEFAVQNVVKDGVVEDDWLLHD